MNILQLVPSQAPTPTFSTLTSLMVFVLTVVTGYGTLYAAYFWEGQLKDWNKKDSFDKLILSFLVGAIISSLTLFGYSPPLDATNFSEWSKWIDANAFFLPFIEALAVLLTIRILAEWLHVVKKFGKEQRKRVLDILFVPFVLTIVACLYFAFSYHLIIMAYSNWPTGGYFGFFVMVAIAGGSSIVTCYILLKIYRIAWSQFV